MGALQRIESSAKKEGQLDLVVLNSVNEAIKKVNKINRLFVKKLTDLVPYDHWKHKYKLRFAKTTNLEELNIRNEETVEFTISATGTSAGTYAAPRAHFLVKRRGDLDRFSKYILEALALLKKGNNYYVHLEALALSLQEEIDHYLDSLRDAGDERYSRSLELTDEEKGYVSAIMTIGEEIDDIIAFLEKIASEDKDFDRVWGKVEFSNQKPGAQASIFTRRSTAFFIKSNDLRQDYYLLKGKLEELGVKITEFYRLQQRITQFIKRLRD